MSVSQSPESGPAAQEEPPLSLEEARAVRWQVSPYEPMGQMFDEGRLPRKDLLWAIEKAFRPDVRRAARRLLAELDATPGPQVSAPATMPERAGANGEPARHGPRVVAASAYLEEQQEMSFGLLSYIMGLGVAVIIWQVYNVARDLVMGAPPLRIGLSLVTIPVIIAIIGYRFLKHRREWRNARAGRLGEEQALDALRESLDSRWTIYRGLQLPGQKADLDLVLVGPGGVWCVQVKAYSAPLRYHEGRWEYRRGKTWRPCDPTFDPEKGVTRQALQLHNFLAHAGVDRFVERAIALAEAMPADAVAASPVPVWLPFDIRQRAAALATRTPMAEAERARVNELLDRRAVEQRAVEEDRRRKGR